MNAIIGLPGVDTSELISPRNKNIKQLVDVLNAKGYIVTSENHIALCLLAASVSDYSKVKSIRYTKDSVVIEAETSMHLNLQSVRMLAKGMKHFTIDDDLRFYARQLAADLLACENVLLFVNSKPPQKLVPLIVLPDIKGAKQRENDTLCRFADVVLSSSEFIQNPVKFLTESNQRLKNLHTNQQHALLEAFTPTQAFTKKVFPHHALMQSLKLLVKDRVHELTAMHEWNLDRLDLEYQALFRLTTFSATELSRCPKLISYENHNIPQASSVIGYYNTLTYCSADFDSGLIDKIITEQALVILDRLKKSPLPIDLFLSTREMHDAERPTLHKTVTGIFAIDKLGKRRKVYFKEVELSLARQIHNDFHYIHTPRADFAFGLYYADESYPFSVVALEKIDRSYKQIALAMFGYDAENCLDFTRLYSRPGGPKNASSVIFRELKDRLRLIMPNIQAGISTHMPTYTHGNSMLAGGFSIPFLLKQNSHSFVARTIDGNTCYEMVTNRRLANDTETDQDILTTRLPLLPVIELIAPFNRPRLEPLFDVGKVMLIKKKTHETYA